MAVGYVILNEENASSPVVCGDGGMVYSDRLAVEREARRLRRDHHSKDFNVYELADPGIVYVLSEEDVYNVAKEKRINRNKVKHKMDAIREIVENGFYNWHDIIEDAIDRALLDE